MIKSKKYIIAAICAALCLSFVGCGKKSEAKPEDTAETQNAEREESEKAAGDSEDKKEAEPEADKAADSKSDASDNSDNGDEDLPVVTMDEFMDMTNEFNNTDDPERKEELRKEIENILNQLDEESESN